MHYFTPLVVYIFQFELTNIFLSNRKLIIAICGTMYNLC